MMMALLSQVPNPSALEVDKLEDDYWEAYDATFNYKVYRQEEEPPAPANCLLWVSQAPELSFSSTEPIKKLPKLVI